MTRRIEVRSHQQFDGSRVELRDALLSLRLVERVSAVNRFGSLRQIVDVVGTRVEVDDCP
ncbi:MAG TPA: hypothetical protein VEP67_12530 [Thiobacillaceae bacterium]|nr:hypothetical protein [Thiobacillaceae bacterium]